MGKGSVDGEGVSGKIVGVAGGWLGAGKVAVSGVTVAVGGGVAVIDGDDCEVRPQARVAKTNAVRMKIFFIIPSILINQTELSKRLWNLWDR